MKNKRKLKQKFKRRKTIRSWGKRQVKWESYNLKRNKVKTIDYFDMFGYEEEENE